MCFFLVVVVFFFFTSSCVSLHFEGKSLFVKSDLSPLLEKGAFVSLLRKGFSKE